MTVGRESALIGPAIAAVVLLTVLCYWPSLDGPFFFDDVPNLELLGDRGGLSTFESYVEFVASAEAGPLGRPLSLASFTLNASTWPTDAKPFRITNLVIHLINGLLIFQLARMLFAGTYGRETAANLALLCFALWMVHPLLVSTTAYIIQRMTQLTSLFMLTGLICYVHGRTMLSKQAQQGWTWIIAGMGVSGALAVFSKETGILLPLYALVIELTLFSRCTDLARRTRNALIAILCLPLLALLSYMVLTWDALQLYFEFRPFTVMERLLTQAVVLGDYLHQSFAPHLSGLGIIHDDYVISRGLLDPPATLISLLGLVALFSFAVWSRKKWPFVSLGILWFFAGHSLEAGPLPLELYFDHRNYLPLAGLLLAACSLLPVLPGQLRRAAPLVLVLFFCLEIFLTWQSARLWSDEDLMMQTALIDHPDSLRAQQYVANQHIYGGDYEQALGSQETIASSFPAHTSTRLSILNLSCLLGELTPEKVIETRTFVERGDYDTQIIGFFSPLMSTAAAASCPAYGESEFQATLDAVLGNPVLSRNDEVRGAAHYFKGIAYEKSGFLDRALQQLDLSYASQPEIDIRLQQIVWLLARGRADEAGRYLALAHEHRDERFWRSRLRDRDLAALRQQIDLARRREKDAAES